MSRYVFEMTPDGMWKTTANARWLDGRIGRVRVYLADMHKAYFDDPACTCTIVPIVAGGQVQIIKIGGQDDCPVHGLAAISPE